MILLLIFLPFTFRSTQCDEYGRCPCHDQVEGKTCDKCIGKKLGIRKGCFDCPRCYDFVETEFTDYKQLVDQKKQVQFQSLKILNTI